MRKILLSSLLTTAICFSGMAVPKVTVTPVGELPSPESLPAKKSVSTADLLVKENFAGFTSGSEFAPDYSKDMAQNGLINPEFTQGGQWNGAYVYSAGGACALSTNPAQDFAYIATPQMDYSGSLKITFMAKFEYVEFMKAPSVKSFPLPASTMLIIR
ncbi:MAG: hypothetical protein K2H75_08555 [Muribaculaceae bacterium]|nr:hypothetical protein [Muribaculaceae bacterium]